MKYLKLFKQNYPGSTSFNIDSPNFLHLV